MTLVEIEKSDLILPAMVYRTPVWCFAVYEAGNIGFDWMGEGKLGRTAVKVGSVTVNNIVYTNASDITEPEGTAALKRKEFCQIKNMVYVRTEDDNPLWAYYKPKYNAITGFTDGKPHERGGVMYKGGIDYAPRLRDEADSLEYGRMKFASENIALVNTGGEYDDAQDYFGNNARVKSDITGEMEGLYEYYIKNVKIKEDKVSFVCGDRREKLIQKVPGRRFTAAEFPHMRRELEGGIMQDAYGECEWVKCVCVDELKIFNGESRESGLKPYRAFYAARKITELKLLDTRPDGKGRPRNTPMPNHVWVKMAQPDNPDSADPTRKGPWNGEVWTPCLVRSIDSKNGLFTLETKYCMPPAAADDGDWENYDVPEIYEVRACGVFWAPDGKTEARPLDIIKELLGHYCGIPWDRYWYRQEKMEEEIGILAPVGIVYGSETGVFEAIEKLQNASDYGFRFLAEYDKFSARRDDNKREPAGTIKITDIADIGKAEIDMRQEHYATVVDIAYSRNYYQDNASHYEGKANQTELLNIHGIDKVHAPETYLTGEGRAKQKAERLEDFFRKTRVMISNLGVLNWPNLRVYDIVRVDLRIPAERGKEPERAAVLFGAPEKEIVAFGDWPEEITAAAFAETGKGPAYRLFGGKETPLTCKVMGINLDADTGVNTLKLLEVGDDD